VNKRIKQAVVRDAEGRAVQVFNAGPPDDTGHQVFTPGVFLDYTDRRPPYTKHFIYEDGTEDPPLESEKGKES